MRSVLLETAVTSKVCPSLPDPEVILVRLIVCVEAVSSLIAVGFPIGSSVGWSLISFTVTVNVFSTVPFCKAPSSVTVTVTVTVPDLSNTGTKASVPLAGSAP